jgi:hypothetical protein
MMTPEERAALIAQVISKYPDAKVVYRKKDAEAREPFFYVWKGGEYHWLCARTNSLGRMDNPWY